MKAHWEKWEFHTLEDTVKGVLERRAARTKELSEQLDREVAEYEALPWCRRMWVSNPMQGSWLASFGTEDRLYWSRLTERDVLCLQERIQQAIKAGASSLTLDNDEIALLK